MVSVRINKEEQKDIQAYRDKYSVDIAVLIRETIKEVLLQDYSEIQRILIETNNKYPQKTSNVRDKSIKLRLDAFLGEVFQEICKKNHVNFTSIIRGFLFDEIYK